MIARVTLFALAGCGRIGFGPVDDAGSPGRIEVVVDIVGQGAVASAPDGLSCLDHCAATFDSPVTLTGFPGAYASVGQWDGTTCGPGPRCVIDASAHVTVHFDGPLVVANRAFATATLFTGALKSVTDPDGLAGADRACQTAASDAGLGGTFVALMSSNTIGVDAIGKLAGSRGWQQLDGSMVFDDLADVSATNLRHPLDRDEHGTLITSGDVWSGGARDGRADAAEPDCLGFTSGIASDFSTIWFTEFDAYSAVGSTASCNTMASLPCFETGHDVALPVPFPLGRYLFDSTLLFDATSGITSADALCASEASAAGLPGSYVALLATMAASAADRAGGFQGPWRDPAGELLAFDQLGPTLQTVIRRHANGAIATPAIGFGVTGLADVGVAFSTCTDWTGVGGGSAARPYPKLVNWMTYGLGDCSIRRVFCVEHAP